MQVFKGSYFSVGSYFIAKGTTFVNYVHLLQSEV